MYVSWPSQVHDARVFANSSRVVTFCQTGVDEKDVPLVALGDPAYPLLPWLMKVYPNNSYLSCEQKRFNYHLSKARVVVEHG